MSFARQPRRRRARVLGQRPARPVRAARQPGQPALLVDAARPGALLSQAPRDAARAGLMPLDDYLDERGYGRAFRDDHLYPMAAAIWSTPAAQIGRYPDRGLRPLLREPPPADARRAAGVAHRQRRQPRVRAAADAPRLGDRVRTGARRARGAARRARRVGARRAAGERALRPRRHRHPRRPGACACCPTPSADERRLLGAFALQPQPRRAARRPGADAAPARGVVELELRRRPAPRRRRSASPTG